MISRFALHGILQQVPLAALPVEAPEALWLADLTTPVPGPALTDLSPSAPGALTELAPQTPTFIVDPRLNLPSAKSSRHLYQTLFPGAHLHSGRSATREAVRTALVHSPFVHLDAHGHYDPAFPQLSAIELHDGLLYVVDLPPPPLYPTFANLSGCNTGRWPITAGSGRYGLAGILARRGIAWVIASRTTITDQLGYDFNQAFYQQIARGQRPPDAFAQAMQDLRESYPAAAWSGLFLMGTGSSGGKTPPEGLWKSSEEVNDAT